MKHKCPNRYVGDGAKGACFVEIEPGTAEDAAYLKAGWSCVIVHNEEIPISWISELIAIAGAHVGGIRGFLEQHNYGGGYALMVDPEKKS